jgi:hypothetical protein
LAALRADISGLLPTEIEATPGMIRRLLRPRPEKEIAPGSVLDPIDVSDAETRVELLSECRNFASELAVNEVTMRAHSDLSLYLETGTKVLLDSLRQAGDADRPFRQPQVDAAIRFCRTIFGNMRACWPRRPRLPCRPRGSSARSSELEPVDGPSLRRPVAKTWPEARNCRAAVPIAAVIARDVNTRRACNIAAEPASADGPATVTL